jgi:hypothetical protein
VSAQIDVVAMPVAARLEDGDQLVLRSVEAPYTRDALDPDRGILSSV